MTHDTNKCQYCGADAIDPTKWECGALLHDLGYGEIVVGQSDYCKLIQKTKEVAKLRELLNRVIETAETLSSGGSRACRELHHAKKDRHELGEVCPVEEKIENAIRNLVMLKAEARLAPAPEESVIQDSRITEPEWRELVPDEVIEEGDEWYGFAAYVLGWYRAEKRHIGTKKRSCAYRFRTRRPLPTTNHKCFSSKLVDEPKREEVPLEDELDYLTREASRASDIHNHVLIVDYLRYLRDEIEKLKQK